MTRTNRKEKKKIDKNKVFSMIIISALFLVPIIVGAIVSSNNTIKAEIISYEQVEDYRMSFHGDDYLWFDMSDEEGKDLIENPENYKGYDIDLKINNISQQTVYEAEANVSQRYKDIWTNNADFAEWSIDILPHDSYTGSVFIIVKTSDMTEKEIDESIRSIGITVSARNAEWLPFTTSETIYFEK